MITDIQYQILQDINEVIEEERGTSVDIEDLIIKSNLDSFAYTIFWLTLEKKYPQINQEKVLELDSNNLTVKELVLFIENSLG